MLPPYLCCRMDTLSLLILRFWVESLCSPLCWACLETLWLMKHIQNQTFKNSCSNKKAVFPQLGKRLEKDWKTCWTVALCFHYGFPFWRQCFLFVFLSPPSSNPLYRGSILIFICNRVWGGNGMRSHSRAVFSSWAKLIKYKECSLPLSRHRRYLIVFLEAMCITFCTAFGIIL